MHTGALPPNIKPTKNRRVQKFKSDYAEFRKEFERIKEEVSQLVIANEEKKRTSFCQLDSTQRHNAPSSSPQAQACPSPQTPGDASLHHTLPHPLLH